MVLMRWNPFQEMDALRNEMNRLFEPFTRAAFNETRSVAWYPPVDVEETSDRLYVRAELPGIDQRDLSIEFENGLLTIRGEKKLEKEQKERTFHRVERAYGTFVRTFSIPGSVDPDQATARYENGVLELEMPKREEAKARRIEIGTGSGSRPKQIETTRAA